MTIQANTRDYIDDLVEEGYTAGYRHANYAVAYSPQDVWNLPESPTGMSDVEFSYYLSGYNEGAADYIAEYEFPEDEEN